MAGGFRIKRVQEEPSAEDGRRVLVDRLWPRGVSKERAHLDEWAKDVAPSDELRRWYHQDPEHRRDEFAERYDAELESDERRGAVDDLRTQAAKQTVTLLTATKDVEHSHVPVLLRHLK